MGLLCQRLGEFTVLLDSPNSPPQLNPFEFLPATYERICFLKVLITESVIRLRIFPSLMGEK